MYIVSISDVLNDYKGQPWLSLSYRGLNNYCKGWYDLNMSSGTVV